MSAPIDVDRARVLAYRVAAQQLNRRVAQPGELAVLDLGVADTPPGSARLAFATRTGEPCELDLPTVWGARGAPFQHRPADLPALAAALWPRDDADAKARLGGSSVRIPGSGVAAILSVAGAMRKIVKRPMSKGEMSTALTAAVPAELTAFCPGCKATHVNEQLIRIAGLPAGVRLEPGTTPLVVAPLADWLGLPSQPAGLTEPALAYLRLHGPATQASVAAYLAASRPAVSASWPGGLIEVRVDGVGGHWLPAERVDELKTPPPPEFVRLLPPSDPFLQLRDRDRLVPERARQKALWRPLGNPGAVLADGEIVGTWRPKTSGRRLTLTIDAFVPLAPPIKAAIEAEAELVATARGLNTAEVTY